MTFILFVSCWLVLVGRVEACGSRSEAVQNLDRRRIIQGDDALEGNWPWHVGLTRNGEYRCGGSLIASHWVLTAAHCVHSTTEASAFSVRAGTSLKTGTSTHLQTVSVESLHMHEEYNKETVANDIALLRLSAAVELGDYVRPICLPTQGETFPPEEYVECYTTGWGALDTYSTLFPTQLQELRVDMVSDETCEANPDIIYEPIAFDRETMICAGYSDSSASACRGDSGGSLVCQSNDTNTWTQAGITSWVPGIGNISCISYTVFTQTDHYQTWINRTMEEWLPQSSGGILPTMANHAVLLWLFTSKLLT